MNTMTKRILRGESGAGSLALVLVLLVVGGLILTPLLGLMSTGLMAGQVYERHTHRLYAADSGVEDAIWKILNDPPETYPYHYPEPLIVDGKTVDVVVDRYDWDPTCGENFTYRILSTVVSDDDSGVASITNTTTIDAHLSVSYLDLANLLDNAIISDIFIGIKNGVYVSGNVTSGGTVDNKGTVNGTITENAELDWPTAEDLSIWYLDDVDGEEHYYGNTVIDLEGSSCPPGPVYINGIENYDWPSGLGPLHVDGELEITSSDQHLDATLTLNGTLYITGDTEIHGPNDKEPYRLTIDLNGQTIFVASPSSKSRTPPDAKPALSIDNCYVVGSGCIIAVGDVYFAPKGDVGGEDDFVLVMSVDGTTTLQPSGAFYGCIAGDLSVDVKSGKNATIIHTAPEGKGLNIPWGAGDYQKLPPVTGTSIESWEIN